MQVKLAYCPLQQQQILFARSKEKAIHWKLIKIKTTSDRLPDSQLAINAGRLW